jgi:transketolase
LAAIVDRNCLQIHGSTEQIMPLEPLATRFRVFGWHVVETDGHDVRGLQAALDEASATKGRPTLIIAHTVKGKGVSYMENRAEWHSRPMRPDEYELALAELASGGGR